MSSAREQPDPLGELRRQIEQARELPEPSDHVYSADPLARLRQTIAGVEPPSRERAPASSGATPPVDAPDPSSLDALVGREVLELLSKQPLPGPARAEAIRRASVAARNPSPDNVRAILEVLLSASDEPTR